MKSADVDNREGGTTLINKMWIKVILLNPSLSETFSPHKKKHTKFEIISKVHYLFQSYGSINGLELSHGGSVINKVIMKRRRFYKYRCIQVIN